jgi:hypothetical protein
MWYKLVVETKASASTIMCVARDFSGIESRDGICRELLRMGYQPLERIQTSGGQPSKVEHDV